MARKPKAPHGSKAAFVRANPDVKAPELVALAKKQGLSLTAGYVYNIRASGKGKLQPSPAKQPSSDATSPPSAATGQLSRMDAQLRSLILSIGLYRAEQVFSDLKASLSRIA